ncbi:MAG TPA: sulfite exporter TauE/SafE family protein [Bryobacteraceae bacterium]|nr:sulfite exporter TauE/SafE family protein [Bryobacteraceae bacterium]
MFDAILALAAFLAGAVASISGFGIGSILTSLLSLETGTPVAVAAISVPHLAATVARFWMLRASVDRPILLHFGILSAAGGLTGALLHSMASSRALSLVFAALLIFTGLTGLTGYARRMRFGRRAAWIAGGVSGVLGGLVGNQGGIRSAALLGFGLGRHSFVATATAIGLIVDAARMPVYFVTAGGEMLSVARQIGIATAATVAGTLLGARLLRRIPEHVFKPLVAIMVLLLGLWMLVRAQLE